MNGRRWRPLWIAIAAAGLAAAAFLFFRLMPPVARLPGPGSQKYEAMVSAFFAGVSALDSDANTIAREALTQATTIIPEEPAAWANLALAEIRLGHFDTALPLLSKAQALAPDNGAIERMFAILENRRGRFPESIEHLKRAIAIEPSDIRSRYALVQELERQEGGDAEALAILGEIVKAHPKNLAALIDRARLAAKLGNKDVLNAAVRQLGDLSSSWPEKARDQYQLLDKAAAGSNPRLVPTRVLVLRNVLLTFPAFRQSIEVLMLPVGTVGEPIESFVLLAPPQATAAPPDLQISYKAETRPPLKADAIAIVPEVDAVPPVVLAIDGREVRRSDGAAVCRFPGGPKGTPPTMSGVLASDWTSDNIMDLVLAGAGGLAFVRGKSGGLFVDVSADTKLAADILAADTFGVWAADIEMDGDLDFVVAPRQGPAHALINHGDGSFHQARPFGAGIVLRGFAWADFDHDGDPDAATIDAKGVLRIFRNERSGRFDPWRSPDDITGVSAIAVADADADGTPDLLLLGPGSVVRLSRRDGGSEWETAEIARREKSSSADPLGSSALLVADLDNNGAIDLIAVDDSRTELWLGSDGKSGWLPVPAPRFRAFAACDLNRDGRIDLAGLTDSRQLTIQMGQTTKNYGWLNVLPRAAKAQGDGRINSFGVGGEVQIRAGLLFQAQAIAGPSVHFGLGNHASADVVRVIWPNGTMQAEFRPKADTSVVAQQRLKGSCPFLYAFDGENVEFVTDFLWRSPLGLRINAQDTAGVSQTEDRVKIRRDQLAARDGFYDLRITAELWETHYWDHVALMTVDHPGSTEIFIDERFSRVPPALDVHATGRPRPVARAIDDRGEDVTEILRDRDGRYLDSFGLGAYQGVTRDHWVELDIPEGPGLRLIANGWIHPTDSSINVALSQNGHHPPQGLVLEVPDRDGNWAAARDDLGFPAGKNKTIVIDLDGLFHPGTPRKIRLRTNLEIYWDSLAVAAADTKSSVKTQRLSPSVAELRYRGFSATAQASPSAPEVPRYGTIDGTLQRWNDLIGLYTRFGDVRELLQSVDDRYVIANAGDELVLRFPVPSGPPAGWVRDFVLIGDGWNKDGDYNTAFSKTVLPLPSHENPAYNTPPGPLEEDPVYRRHPRDWELFHTRLVTPRTFWRGPRSDPQGVRSLVP